MSKENKRNKRRHYKIHKHPTDHNYYYTDNETWYNKIKANQCPEYDCNAPIKKTEIGDSTKRVCTFNKNHLEIYGNPQTIAYQRKEVIILPKIDYSKCEECECPDIRQDPKTGDKYCFKCGLVQNTSPIMIFDDQTTIRSDYNPSNYNDEDLVNQRIKKGG